LIEIDKERVKLKREEMVETWKLLR